MNLFNHGIGDSVDPRAVGRILQEKYFLSVPEFKPWTVQTELVSTLEKNATKPNPFEILLLQSTRKENNWKTEETLEREQL